MRFWAGYVVIELVIDPGASKWAIEAADQVTAETVVGKIERSSTLVAGDVVDEPTHERFGFP